MIGRERELDALRAALADTVRGAGRVVAVLGEAGIGKTRLLGAFIDASEALGARALAARSYESEHAFAFGPWVEALRSGGVPADGKLLVSLGRARLAVLARLFAELGEATPSGGNPADALRLFEANAAGGHSPGDMTPLRISLLGGFEVRRGSGAGLSLPTKNAQGPSADLLAVIALSREMEMTSTDLAGAERVASPPGRDYTFAI